MASRFNRLKRGSNAKTRERSADRAYERGLSARSMPSDLGTAVVESSRLADSRSQGNPPRRTAYCWGYPSFDGGVTVCVAALGWGAGAAGGALPTGAVRGGGVFG